MLYKIMSIVIASITVTVVMRGRLLFVAIIKACENASRVSIPVY